MTTNVVTFKGSSVKPKVDFQLQDLLIKPPSINPVIEEKTVPKVEINNQIFDTSFPKPMKTHPPDLVKAVYRDDLNILKIHDAIRCSFGSRLGTVDEQKRKIKEIQKQLKTKHMTFIEYQCRIDEVNRLEKELDELVSGKQWNEYISSVEPIIQEYIPLATDTIKGIVKFKKGAEVIKEDEEQTNRRLQIIDKFLTISSKYIKLDVIRDISFVSKCPNCGNLFDEMLLDSDQGTHICICGYEQVNLAKNSTFKDSSRVNVAGRSQYEDRSTFIRAFERAQGQKIGKIPEKLYEMLDEYFLRKGIPEGKKIKEYPTLPNGKKPKTSVDLLSEALSSTGNAAYYDSIPMIAHVYWGWELPNLSEYREGVISDYDATQKVYEEIKERESSLNVQIRLYLHLRARDYPCDWSDFKILTSRESLEYHHRMWKIMCERTGVKFTPVI